MSINSTLSNTLLSGTSEADSIRNYGHDVTISTGNGDDTVSNKYSSASYVSINTGEGNDSVYNEGEDCTINTGAGNDEVYNYDGDDCTINMGEGNDSIYNYLSDECTINSGAGNDSVYNKWGDDCTINTGAGNDSYYSYSADRCTINTGAGNDLISFIYYSNYNVIIYNSGDGNDIIYGFKKNSTLSIAGSYSSVTSGSDIIFTVGEGKITLVGAASLSAVNVVGDETVSEKMFWAFSGTTATFGTESKTLFTVSGIKSLSGLSLSGNVVTVNNSVLNQETVTISGDYTLALANDVPTPKTSAATWTYKNNVATYKAASTSAGYSLASNGKSITYSTAQAASTLATISGVKSSSGLSVNGNVITVAKSALNGKTVKVSGDYTLALADDVPISKPTSAGWTYNNNVATYKAASTSAGYSLASNGKSITYSAAKAASTLATVSGVKSSSGLSVNGNVITVAKSALNGKTVKVSGDYTLKLADDAPISKPTSAGWTYKNNVATYKAASTSAGYSLASNAKSITYSTAKAASTLATVSGVKSTSGLSVNGKVITIAKSALNGKTVKVSGDYTLALADDVPISKPTSAGWTYSNNVATYKAASTSAGYSLASNAKSITYSKAKAASTLATISGVKSKEGLKVSGNVITVPNKIISKNITVNGKGYEFKFAAGNTSITGSGNADKITNSGANVTIGGGKGNDIISLASNAKNNVISYANGDGNDIIYGLTADDTIKIAKGTAAISTSGNDVIFTVGKGKITIKDAKNKTFSYSDAGGTKTYSTVAPSPDDGDPYTIKGKGITVSDSYAEKNFDVSEIEGGNAVVTINASAVTYGLNITGNEESNYIIGGKGNDTLDGYSGNDTLTGGTGSNVFLYFDGDGNDIITDYKAKDTIKITGQVVTPSAQGRDVILKVGEGKITVKNAVKNNVGVTYIENGVEQGYKDGEKTVSKNEKGTAATITANYFKDSFDFNASKTLATVNATLASQSLSITCNKLRNYIDGTVYDDYIDGDAGNDMIFGGAGNDTLIGGKNNDTLQGDDGKDIFVYSGGDGDDFIVDYRPNDDTVWIKSGTINDAYASEGNVILKVGSGRITIKDGANKFITIKDSKGETTTKRYEEKSQSNVWTDDNYELSPNLSSLVQIKSADYSFVNTSTKLSEENNLIAYTDKK